MLCGMKTYPLAHTELKISRLAYGCMQIGGTWDDAPLTSYDRARARNVIERALAHGINFFDHADIYCHGKSETVFAHALRELGVPRDRIILQSKCGIRFADDVTPGSPTRFDFSYEHILRTVEGSLQRLQTDYLDILLLHRPDALVEPEEVAHALDELHRAGKVRYFGVSNHTAAQITLLQKFVQQPLLVNQVELNLLHADLIDDGLFFNTAPRPYTGIGGTLDFCRANGMLIQAWAPVANGLLFNPPEDAPANVRRVAGLIAQMARAKNTTPEAIALAWLLRHPAPIQPILGTTRPERVADSCRADEIELTREEWYFLLETARGRAVP
jgi:predicted oxidoreductase